MKTSVHLAGAAALLPLSLSPWLASQAAAPNPVWSSVDAAPGTRLGCALASAGDVDGDRLADLVVGARSAPGGGAARMLSGRDGSLLRTLAPPGGASWFGFAVDGGHDVDGDGVPDVVVGAPLGTPNTGSAHVFSGADGSLLASFAGGAPGDRFGESVALLGDVDGDARADLAFGAPNADGGGTNAGEVRVLSGATGAVLHVLAGTTGDFLGSHVARHCDVDGDGRAEVLVGVPFADAGGFNAGRALIVSGATGQVLRILEGTTAGDRLGSRVASLGDLDGDGFAECGLGAPGADLGGFDSGAVEVRSGADGSLLFAVPGHAPGEFMQTVAGLGDADGDGVLDLAVASTAASFAATEAGRVRIVSGVDGSELRALDGASHDWFGADLAALAGRGGILRLAVGAPGHDDFPSHHGAVHVFRGTRRDPVRETGPPRPLLAPRCP